jgi:hypothetical protein
LIGVNVKHTGEHPPEWVRAFGATAIRIVLTPDIDLTGYFETCQAHGVSVLPLLARESDPTERRIAEYAERYGQFFDRIQVGNEPDHESPSSWTMHPAGLSGLGWLARGSFPTCQIVCAGMVSGDPRYLDRVDLDPFDAIAVHPYAKDMTRGNDLPDIDALVRQYMRFGKPIVISEWGWWGAESEGAQRVGDVVAWADETDEIESYFHFCISDDMVWPFGLLREDNSWKPAAYAFRDAVVDIGGEPVPWIGPGIQAELNRLNWTPTSGEHRTTWPVAWASTPTGLDAVVVWNEAEGVAVPYRRVR